MITLYEYAGKVLSVYDGDTCNIEIDLGFKIKYATRLRLYGINTPELNGPDSVKAKEARDYVKSKIEGKNVVIRTHKDQHEKYGRYLAEIFYDPDEKNLNQELVSLGLAVVYLP